MLRQRPQHRANSSSNSGFHGVSSPPMRRQYLLIAASCATAPEVRVLADSLARVDPTVPRTIVVIDNDPQSLEKLGDAGEIRTGTDLGLDPDLVGRWVGAYGERDLIWAAFPNVLSGIGEPGDRVLWIGADVAVVQAPTPLWAALEKSDVVACLAAPSLTPHDRERGNGANDRSLALQPVSAVARHDGELVSRSVLGWKVGSQVSAGVLSEWPVPRDFPTNESLATSATAQLWFNALALSDEVEIVRSASLALSTAQLLSRTVEPGPIDTEPLVDGQPLTLLGLRGFDAREPDLLDGEIVTTASERSALAPVLRQQAAALTKAGRTWTEGDLSSTKDESPCGTRWDELPEGLPHNRMVQGLIRDGLWVGAITHSPFTEAGFDQLRTYALQPAGRGGSVGVNRLLAAVHGVRPDLRTAFPALDSDDGLAFIEWAWNSGRQEMSIPKSFLPPRPRFVKATEKETSGRREPDTEGVNLVGHFTSGIGVGESVRQMVEALEAADVPTTLVQGLFVPSTRQQTELSPVGPQDADHDLNIVVANGYQMPALVRDVGEGFFAGRPTIGVWWWEVDPFPGEEWAPALQWLDELWVGTDFIRSLIEPHVDVPVWVFPVPVSMQRLEWPLDREHFGWKDDETVFLYIWDYHSTEARKNPSGLVEAYRRAFPEESKTRLVLKCINHESVPEVDRKVRRAAAGRSDIEFIDCFISNREKNALLELCDCYVSPHRSEGFGYAPAEAMLLSKPVVMTGYGGTTQYADDTVARIVKWTPAKVGPGASPYPPDGRWADPDLDDLAAALRWIVEEPEAAAAMAERGRRRVAEQHNVVASGTAMRGRLEIVRARGAGSRSSAAQPLARRVIRRLARNRVTGLPLRALRRKWRSLMDNAVKSRTAELNQHVAELQQCVAIATEGFGEEERARRALTARVEQLESRLEEQRAAMHQRNNEAPSKPEE